MEDEELVSVGLLYGVVAITSALNVVKRNKNKSVWLKPWIMQMPVYGAYSSLFNDLLNSDETSFETLCGWIIPPFKSCCRLWSLIKCLALLYLRVIIKSLCDWSTGKNTPKKYAVN